MTDKTAVLDNEEESDYGSDFGTDDEATLSQLLTQIPSPISTAIVSPFARGTRRKYVDDEGTVFEMVSRDGPVGEASIEIEYDERNCASFSRESHRLFSY